MTGRPAPDRRGRGLRIAGLLLLSVVAGAAAPEHRLELVFERLNGSYADLSPELVPVEAAGVAVRLRSPSNSVELFANRLLLTPRPGGGHRVAVVAEIEAVAEIETELAVGGATNQLRDQVVVPRQELALSGTVDMERTDAGYLVTVLEAPEVLEVAIESHLGVRLVELCRLFPWAVGACDALERGLSSVRLPLPRPGERFAVDAVHLLPSERSRIDRYLEIADRDESVD